MKTVRTRLAETDLSTDWRMVLEAQRESARPRMCQERVCILPSEREVSQERGRDQGRCVMISSAVGEKLLNKPECFLPAEDYVESTWQI